MSNKTMIAALALGAAIAFSGTAFAEKMKATLDGKAEVPPNASAGTGTADIDYDPAEAGKNGGVAVAIPNATSSPAEGSATLTDAQAADLTSGKYYVNVHTAANPGGEIRGQVGK